MAGNFAMPSAVNIQSDPPPNWINILLIGHPDDVPKAGIVVKEYSKSINSIVYKFVGNSSGNPKGGKEILIENEDIIKFPSHFRQLFLELNHILQQQAPSITSGPSQDDSSSSNISESEDDSLNTDDFESSDDEDDKKIDEFAEDDQINFGHRWQEGGY